MRNYSNHGAGDFRPPVPTFDTPRQLVPSVLTVAATANFNLHYLEVANNTGGDISMTVYDQAGLVLLPTQVVKNGTLLIYRSDFGTPMNGLSWIATAPGLVGWFCGAYV